jgi:hypothetical protein
VNQINCLFQNRLGVDFDSALGYFCCVDAVTAADVSEVHAISIFRIEVSMVGVHVYVGYWSNRAAGLDIVSFNIQLRANMDSGQGESYQTAVFGVNSVA